MKKTIICLNGPPLSGKTTVANEVAAMARAHYDLTASRDKFAAPINDVAQAVLGVDDEAFRVLREERKDSFISTASVTPRQLMIAVSEQLIKPLFGQGYYGQQAFSRVMMRPVGLHVFCDTGFQAEYDTFSGECRALGYDVHLVRLTRNGCTFEADSREYVEDDHVLALHNDGSPEDIEWLADKILTHVYGE